MTRRGIERRRQPCDLRWQRIVRRGVGMRARTSNKTQRQEQHNEMAANASHLGSLRSSRRR